MDVSVSINDSRNIKEFKDQTFSKFKKSEVKKELLKCIIHNKLEETCNWSAELICTGSFLDIWEIILLVTGKHINLGNPRLPIYINMRYNIFKKIMNTTNGKDELSLRNNQQLRALFAELFSIICISNKNPAFESIKFNSNSEFILTHLSTRLRAPNMNYAKYIWRDNDPSEIYIAINELSFQLESSQGGLLNCYYWVEWIIEFDRQCRKKKNSIICETRTHIHVESKFQRNVIWIIWDLIIYMSTNTTNKLIKKINDSLLELFSIRYTVSNNKKRKTLIFFAIELLLENRNLDIDIIDNDYKNVISSVCNNIDSIYKKIKKNENYINNSYSTNKENNKSSLLKTMEKLEILNSIS